IVEIDTHPAGLDPFATLDNLNYFISEDVFEFILKAVHFVADHGWKLLPHYRFEPTSGQWFHRRGRPEPPCSLYDLSYRSGRLEYPSLHATEPEWALDGYLDDAHRIVQQAVAAYQGLSCDDPSVSEDFEELRWFPLPGEIQQELQGSSGTAKRCHQQPIQLDR
ncbi:MAG: hypothetical protein AAFX99_12665, partial [Myxococcota bacterium]